MVFGITLIYLLFGTLNYIEITKLLFTEEIIINNYYLYNFSILLILIDLLSNIIKYLCLDKNEREGICQFIFNYFFKNDPLRYRIETIFGIFYISY